MRALEEGATGGGGGGGGAWGLGDGVGAKDGLAQARVALTLKSASARRQRDIVSTIRSEVRVRSCLKRESPWRRSPATTLEALLLSSFDCFWAPQTLPTVFPLTRPPSLYPSRMNENRPVRAQVHLADVQVAAAWQDVMSPPPAPAPGAAVPTTASVSARNAATAAVCLAGSSSAGAAAETTVRGATASTGHSSSAEETSSGADTSSGGHDADSAAAVAGRTGLGGEATSFEIEAGDGLTEDDAADLTAILREVRRGATYAWEGKVRVCREPRPNNLSLGYPDGVCLKTFGSLRQAASCLSSPIRGGGGCCFLWCFSFALSVEHGNLAARPRSVLHFVAPQTANLTERGEPLAREQRRQDGSRWQRQHQQKRRKQQQRQ